MQVQNLQTPFDPTRIRKQMYHECMRLFPHITAVGSSSSKAPNMLPRAETQANVLGLGTNYYPRKDNKLERYRDLLITTTSRSSL